MTVGQRIREKRIELGLSQTDLALKMGYSGKTSVSAAEVCGDNITTTKVEKFAKALGVSVKYLMFGEDDTVADAVKKLPLEKYDPKMIERAIRFLEAYERATPEIQSAIQSLLKVHQSGS